jgi:hypothetical protein
MKVAIIQSNYIPWRGYFDIINDVDLFVFYDDVQYTRRDWRNRNKIKSSSGAEWLTVPVDDSHRTLKIHETKIKYSTNWNKEHIRKLHLSYGKAPYFPIYFDELADLLARPFQTISELNISLCSWLMRKLSIYTQTTISTQFDCHGTRTERLIDLLEKVSATSYLSGPSAKSYLDEDLFRVHKIGLEYKNYYYPSYSQLFGDFIGEVSVLDLLFNKGPQAPDYLKSGLPNTLVVY